jgi:hypothetical protein
MVTRINEKHIYGAFLTRLDSAITGTLFYGTTEEPKTSAKKAWCSVDMDYEEVDSRNNNWVGGGRLTLVINARKSKNAYTSRAIAADITAALVKKAVTITVSSVTSGYIAFNGAASTRSLGEEDGVQSHWWSAEFRVYSIT